MASAAAPTLGVGGRACDWRHQPRPSLASSTAPVLDAARLMCWQPCLCWYGRLYLSLASTAVPLLGVDGRATPWHWRPCLSLPMAAVPVLGVGGHPPILVVGGRTYAWHGGPWLSLASTAEPMVGADGHAFHLHRRPRLCLASVAAPVLGIADPLRSRPHFSLALAAVACTWRRRHRLSVVLAAAPMPGVSGRACA